MGLDSSIKTIDFNEYKQQFGYYPKRRNIIFTYNSPTLNELVKHCNHQSVNLYADTFLKTCGVRLANDSNYDAAILAIKQLLSQQGADLQGFMIRDGSGLSPSGVLTTNNMVGILSIFAQQSFFNDFYQSIPVVGVSGTVKHLAKNTKAHGNIRAKSGSISNTRAYAGYFTSQKGELMSFMMVINRYADEADGLAKKALEELMIRMMEL